MGGTTRTPPVTAFSNQGVKLGFAASKFANQLQPLLTLGLLRAAILVVLLQILLLP